MFARSSADCDVLMLRRSLLHSLNSHNVVGLLSDAADSGSSVAATEYGDACLPPLPLHDKACWTVTPSATSSTKHGNRTPIIRHLHFMLPPPYFSNNLQRSISISLQTSLVPPITK